MSVSLREAEIKEIINIVVREALAWGKSDFIIDRATKNISSLFPPQLTEEEVEKKVKELLLAKTEIFLNCAKDCQRHNCWSGMDTLLSFTAKELSQALIGKCGNVQLSEKDLEEFLRNVFKIEYNGNVYFNRKPFNFVSDWFEVTRKEIYGIIAKALSQKLATPTFSGGRKK